MDRWDFVLALMVFISWIGGFWALIKIAKWLARYWGLNI